MSYIKYLMSKRKHLYSIFDKLAYMSDKKSIAERVFDYIDEEPYIQICLKQDLINFSSLARQIQIKLEIKNFDAIVVAIRRYQEKQKPVQAYTQKIKEVLMKSKMEIRTGINIYLVKKVTEQTLNSNYTHVIRGFDYFLVITDMKINDAIKKNENMTEIRIKSPPEIEEVPGIVYTLTQALFERNINIAETYSCYTDTILIIDKNDLLKTVTCLNKLGIM